MRIALPRIGALLLALLVAVPAGHAQQRERELEELRRAIEQRRARVAEFEREQRGLLETLEEVDRLALKLGAAVKRERQRARSARQRLAELEDRTRVLGSRLEGTRSAMAARAVALYRSGEVGPVQVLFAAEDLRELLTRIEALRRLLEHDRRLLARFQVERSELAAAHDEARVVNDQRERALAQLERRSRQLERERRAKRDLMRRVRDDRSRERAALTELEAAAHALEETLARLPDASHTGPGPAGDARFVELRGHLAAPVAAPILREFGRVVDTEFHTQIFRNGVDFGADLGAPVRAVAAGQVRFAGWFRGYGRLVILDHGARYFTVNGHLDEIRVGVGDAVEQGDVIGTVGDTGSLTGPRLYFEIRHASEPLDPAEWLRDPGAG